MSLLDFLSWVSCITGIFLIIYVIVERKSLSRFVSVEDLGKLELDSGELIEVLVLASLVEYPSGSLAEAVENNFSKGVKYSFLVSNSNAEKELDRYYKIFKDLAEIASEKSGKKIRSSHMVNIKCLPYDWPDVPYIFYTYRKKIGEEEIEEEVVAYRGNQKGEGIADFYEKLPSSQSESIKLTLLSGAPISIIQSGNDNNVTPISKAKSRS